MRPVRKATGDTSRKNAAASHASTTTMPTVMSTATVAHETRLRLRLLGLRWAELAPVADIDEPADLAHLPAGWLA